MWNRRVMPGGATAVALLLSTGLAAQSDAPTCRPSGALMRLAGLPEASGLVASRATEGRLWLHNDSGKPELFAVSAQGAAQGRVTLDGAPLVDWEALSTGPCGSGHCLYVGDIGDNDAERSHITIYRVPEPSASSGSAKVNGIFRAAYPDGAHDAEALLVAPDGTLHIVTKGDTGAIALYRFPRELRTGTTMTLERVGAPMSDGQPGREGRVTDGAVSPDGRQVALRTNTTLTLFDAGAFFKGDWKTLRTIDLGPLGEPLGEALAFGTSGLIYLGGEGGGKGQPGTLGVLTCRE